MACNVAKFLWPRFSGNRSLLCQFCVRSNFNGHHKRSYSSDSDSTCDVTVVGGGIVGLASARELSLRRPDLSITVLEKEKEISMHQTGHNSGVIHAGIYYKPGSLKAKLCVEGLDLLYKYCDEQHVPYKRVGKLIVAVDKEELGRLDDLYKRALKNGCTVSMVEGKDIKQIEPHCKGLKAIHSPLTGIVDYSVVTQAYGKEFQARGGNIQTNFCVNKFSENTSSSHPVSTHSEHGSNIVNSRYVIVCGGLYSDRLAAISGAESLPKIVPFRGDYLVLKPEKTHLVNGNIYPVPDPRFPFLGVHFTPRMNGDIWLGPNAILAFKREGYNFTDFNLKDLSEALMFSGLRKLVFRNLTAGFDELYRVMNKNAQLGKLQRFIPNLTINDVTRGPSGVRAQALDADGNLVDDFIFDSGKGSIGKRMLHVRNAPSPAATSSLAIAKMIADEVENRFQL
ncbi:L-2-hydroxyglutarate dehydrogenase, mitochondrial-like isoform X2 [Clavelina lepadiformis]|uniref:L-2-hydroxyglutarate dehydrogenase, mitochondrial n=2 Tax=Clavelina lepadiformis TaxID=159417 RepID=A0ABP0FKX4_CLALP